MTRWNPVHWFKPQTPPVEAVNDACKNWGEYKGTGIWWICPDCNAPHEVVDQAFFDEVQNACADISGSTQKMYDDFHFNSDSGRWDVDPDNGLFIKTAPDGRKASGRYAVVGSWNEKTHSWLWSWEMDESWIPRAAIEQAHPLLDAGREQEWEITSAKHLLVNAHETWHLTNLAAKIAGFQGTYRAKVNDLNYHYFIIDQLAWDPLQ
ncbi:hypothetical protein DS901_13985 [Loktanella sp. D2R18]|uniref:DUF6882 domain-containing protein n=1 Tax=Rhodobacterales TaxID=204455 RepID=UPI000DEA910B|nr:MULTISPECIES: DUF6882 domain-containing protein [Rhodobacterales]MDO6588917.1 hypothetical protein [Yoonia sp. 1_MG-2023]RBW41864.1 hypothetical protein DS901_13985 [Loktanella sp. D2R18]